jgi:hypothetical protein
MGSKKELHAHVRAKRWHRSVVKAWEESDRETDERKRCLRKWAERGWKVDGVALHPGGDDSRCCDGLGTRPGRAG